MRVDDELLALCARVSGRLSEAPVMFEGVEPDIGHPTNFYGHYDRATDRLRYALRDFLLVSGEIRFLIATKREEDAKAAAPGAGKGDGT